jgi:hypothetical protein
VLVNNNVAGIGESEGTYMRSQSDAVRACVRQDSGDSMF